jgi:two-component system C4-dicarboxylate transport response regulator DctD
VFLDEIESMPLALQVKLLRVIESRAIERLGSNKSIPLDIRFIAATKTGLRGASEAGAFRSDLYYRLGVVTIDIPPLRERKEDIPLLFHHLARQARRRYGREIPDLPPDLILRLAAHDWPGNVRELRNLVDRFVLGLPLGMEIPEEAPAPEAQGLMDRVAVHERSLIVSEIRRNGGNMTATANALGVSRKTLYEKLRKYDIVRGEFSDG